MEEERVNELAEQMKILFGFLSIIKINSLREYEVILNSQIGNYEAIGILDGHNYFKKVDDMRARYERLKALINLIDTFHNTQSKII